MRIVSKYPELYAKYKDRKIRYSIFFGTVVGYYFSCEVILILEIKAVSGCHNLDYFLEHHPKVMLQDYHGNKNN